MTIASEISRLQTAKSDIKTSIENKGVSVGSSLKLDEYPACIDAIEQGGGGCVVDVLVVGGGGGGGGYGSYGGGGGGGGGVVYQKGVYVPEKTTNISVGYGGGGNGEISCLLSGQNGGNSCFGCVVAYGGGGGGGCAGGSGGGARSASSGSENGGTACPFQGNLGGCSLYCYCFNQHIGGGGGGAGSPGHNGVKSYYGVSPSCANGGDGIELDISGAAEKYSGGGGGSGDVCGCGRTRGGGNGGVCTDLRNACGYGGGGGGAVSTLVGGGNGYEGVVYIRYPSDGSYGFCNAIGGEKYVCGDYTIHKFETGGEFTIEPSGCCVKYIVVGGGGRGCGGGGGGGAVCLGIKELTEGVAPILVGNGGTCEAPNGGTSMLDNIAAPGGRTPTTHCSCACANVGGISGSGIHGHRSSCNISCKGGGGAGSRGAGYSTCDGTIRCSIAGCGLCGYGGGGGGGGWTQEGIDGGGRGTTNDATVTPATNCGGGGGGATTFDCSGDGACGLVEVCYPSDGSYGFSSATGGDSCYTCDGYCVHRFTSNGLFKVSGAGNYIKYLVVGGGGGGGGIVSSYGYGGGGGGQVLCGILPKSIGSYPIIIGAGGAGGVTGCTCGEDGGDTYFGEMVAKGGTKACGFCGGVSGSGFTGGNNGCCAGGGGGGAGSNGSRPATNSPAGGGGAGLYGYGGGGGGGGCYKGAGGYACDGGGMGGCCISAGGNATNYGGGGGGSNCCTGGAGCQGVVDICYEPGTLTATGGDTCYTCDGYCVHRFTSDGTFTIVS